MTEDFPNEHIQPEEQDGIAAQTINSTDLGSGDGQTGYPNDLDGEPTTETPVVDPDAGRIKDKELAVDVAYAGKPARDLALRKRDKAESVRQLAQDLDERLDSQATLEPDEREEIEQEFRTKIGTRDVELIDAVRDRISNRDFDNRIISEDDEQREKEIMDIIADSHDEEAKKEIRNAERKEEWTEILGTKPLSEAFRQAHNVDAGYLMRIEDSIPKSKADLQRHQQMLEQLERNPILAIKGSDILADNRMPSLSTLMRTAYIPQLTDSDHQGDDPADKEAYDAYTEAISNPETTLGQLRDMYVQAYRKAYTKPLQKSIEVSESIIQDVKTGRASDPEYKKDV